MQYQDLQRLQQIFRGLCVPLFLLMMFYEEKPLFFSHKTVVKVLSHTLKIPLGFFQKKGSIFLLYICHNRCDKKGLISMGKFITVVMY